MDVVKLSISKPVGVTVGVLLLVMFGLIGLTAIPIQLTPTVDRPIITVETDWPGRTPEEVVDEITKEQEKQIKNVSNLKRMVSTSRDGGVTITLEFTLGTNINRALQEVGDALRQVPDYPEEVTEPRIKAADGASENAIAWIILDIAPEAREKHAGFDLTTLFDALDREVKPFLERVDGVAEINIYGGREREVRVYVDPTKLANRGLNHLDMIEALRNENRNITGGTIAEGKRDYRVRVTGQYEEPREILDTIIAYRDGRPVFVRDVATVELGHQKRRGFVRTQGVPAIAINAIRQQNANVVQVMEELRERLDEVRADILPNIAPGVGPDLRLTQVYDETIYIDSSIRLVTQNLWVGGTIAAIVLLIFLRSFVSTGIVAIAIPVSVIGTFLVLLAFGRTLNVISLAGLAFAVGMVVDNAIVVLENIYRRLQSGEPPMVAAYRGGKEVWGAILASTLTTVAVFVPVITIQEEAGQLFRDITLAIVASVSLSLFVSITVIPAACSRWFKPVRKERHGRIRTLWEDLFGLGPLCARLVHGLGSGIKWMITGWRGWTIRPAVIVTMMTASITAAIVLAPPLDYLPAGNRNLVFGGMLIPPGLSIEQQELLAERVEAVIAPYQLHGGRTMEEVLRDAPPISNIFDPTAPTFDPVPIDNFFIAGFQGGMFAGATSAIDEVVIPVGTILSNAMSGTSPDVFGGARQTSLFGMGAGGGNTIDIEISGPNLANVIAATEMMYGIAGQKYGFGVGVAAEPSNFNLQQPEYRVRVNDAGRRLGLSTSAVGTGVRALFDGAFAGEFRLPDDSVDLVLVPTGGRLEYKEQLASIPIWTPGGRIVPMDSVVDVIPGLAPQQIQRVEELPSVILKVTPPQGRALEDVMREIRREIIEPARQAGLIDRTMRVRLEGTAAKLDEVNSALFGANPNPPDGSNGTAGGRGAAGLFGRVAGFGLIALGIGVAVYAGVKAVRQKKVSLAYGAAGAILLGGVLATLTITFGDNPQFITARFIWALAVTYLLMCALFESFAYPFVIMFSVPLAVVGGFVGLKIVHELSMRDPTIAPQQLDVLTMLGFVILIGVVVNNSILLVDRALQQMRGHDGEVVGRYDAIAYAVRTRARPILMGTMTSVGGMSPLVLFPGAGSEMYRGLGSVVIGGLLCAAVFTLVLVPLMFSLMLDMISGLRQALGMSTDAVSRPEDDWSHPPTQDAKRTPKPDPRPENGRTPLPA
ncbi:MAG: efflux RND transporter permease subunit [Phycisphaerales bacterium]|nr:MAG: efflux RND transporter permease subunit [Phycisphaerales bacterium]